MWVPFYYTVDAEYRVDTVCNGCIKFEFNVLSFYTKNDSNDLSAYINKYIFMIFFWYIY